MRLSGKTAIITGSGSGIGAVGARRFAKEGANVVITDIDAKVGNACAKAISDEGGSASFVQCDAYDETSVAAAVEHAVSHFGGLDILYNNIGGSTPRDSSVTEVDLDEFWRAIKHDLFTTFLFSRHGIRAMLAQGRGGSVIHTSSFNAVIGSPGRDCYTAAKGGIISLTRSMALEYGYQNIRVNCIASGAVQSPRVAKFVHDAPNHPAFVSTNRHKRPEVSSHILGLVEMEDIAAMAAFLASDDSRKVTGTIQLVDSGATAT